MQNMLEDLALLYQAMMDSAADAIIVIDQRGTILHFSRSAEQLFGYTEADCQGQNVSMLMPEPFRTEHDTYLANYQHSGVAKIIGKGRDVQGRKQDGSLFPMHLSVGKARLRDNICYIGICHDLSEYRQTLSEKLQLESLQNALFNAAVDGIITIDGFGTIKSFNKAAEQLFGYSSQEALGQNVNILMPSPFKEHHESYLDNYLSTGQAHIIGLGRDVPGLRKDGSIFPMRLSVGKAENSTETLYIGVCHDLTHYQNALIELAKAEQRYKSIVECQGQIICRLDQDFKLTFANRSFQKIFQCHEQEVLGMHFINFIPGDKREMQQVLQEVIQGEPEAQIHFKTLMLRKSGRFNIEWWFTKVPIEGGITEIQGYGIDVSEKEEAIRQATFLKNYDMLTGLLNLDAFISAFKMRLQNECYGIFYLDCNHFGLINNRYGFDIGDKMLIEAAKRLRQCVKKPSLLCRPGADEFILAVEIDDASSAMALAECMMDCLTEPYLLEDQDIRVSGKIGIAIFPEDGLTVNEVIRKAESVLARAKQSPNKIAFYDEQVNANLKRQLDVEQRLRLALEQNALQVYLQAKVELSTNQVIGYEALLRWHDDVLGQVSPLEFIKVAEQMGLAIQVDRFVLSTVFHHLANCLQHNIQVQPIAVNITSAHFNERGLTETIFELHRQTQVPLSLLELEITEGVLLEMTPQVKENLSLLRHNGIKIAIDDFGTGYSSLSYVKQFTVDTIKIDKSFIDDLNTETGRQLLSAVIAIAKALKLSIVAEGVETATQKDVLLKMGCDIAQGYYYAKPSPLNDVLPVR